MPSSHAHKRSSKQTNLDAVDEGLQRFAVLEAAAALCQQRCVGLGRKVRGNTSEEVREGSSNVGIQKKAALVCLQWSGGMGVSCC